MNVALQLLHLLLIMLVPLHDLGRPTFELSLFQIDLFATGIGRLGLVSGIHLDVFVVIAIVIIVSLDIFFTSLIHFVIHS